MTTVAALYVLERSSPYREIDGVDLWPRSRDARLYSGPWPVVAHPPCGPWSRWMRGKCGEAMRSYKPLAVGAVLQVRRYGGVLEHPAGSLLWETMRLPRPCPSCGAAGAPLDRLGGFTVEVELSRWGAPVVKPTWLYFVGADRGVVADSLPPMAPRPPPTSSAVRGDGRHRDNFSALSSQARKRTPPAMARWLVDMARTCRPPAGAEVA